MPKQLILARITATLLDNLPVRVHGVTELARRIMQDMVIDDEGKDITNVEKMEEYVRWEEAEHKQDEEIDKYINAEEILQKMDVVTPEELEERYKEISEHEVETRIIKEKKKTYKEDYESLMDLLSNAIKSVEVQKKEGEETTPIGNWGKVVETIFDNNKVMWLFKQRMRETMKQLRSIMEKRRQASTNSLLFLPKCGTNTKIDHGELNKLPEYDSQNDEHSLFRTWQYVSKFVEVYGLSERTALECLKYKTKGQVYRFISQKEKRNPMAVVISDLQNTFERFPTKKEWAETYENFKRNEGEPIMNAYCRFRTVARARFHEASEKDFNIIVKLEAANRFHRFVSEETLNYIKLIEKREEIRPHRLEQITMRMALARIHEDVNKSWNMKYLTDPARKYELMVAKRFPIGNMKERIKKARANILAEYLPDNANMTRNVQQPSVAGKLPQRIITEIHRDKQTITHRFIDPTTIIPRKDIVKMEDPGESVTETAMIIDGSPHQDQLDSESDLDDYDSTDSDMEDFIMEDPTWNFHEGRDEVDGYVMRHNRTMV